MCQCPGIEGDSTGPKETQTSELLQCTQVYCCVPRMGITVYHASELLFTTYQNYCVPCIRTTVYQASVAPYSSFLNLHSNPRRRVRIPTLDAYKILWKERRERMVIHAHTCVRTHLWVCTYVEMGTCVMDDFSSLLSCQSSAFSRNHTLHLGFARVLIFRC